MSEAVNPNVYQPSASESEYETEPATESQLGKRARKTLKEKPVTVFSTLFVGSIVAGLLIGYIGARIREDTSRERLIDEWTRELTKWMRERGGKIANPLKECYEATRSAAEELSQSGARLAQQLNPLIKKRKRTLFGIF